jgi:protein-S-isoprenylcysteine O-methyltransferase Ste14
MFALKENYPKILVFLQFSLMGLIALLSKGFFSSPLSMGIFLLGAILGIWALLHNKLGNFNIQPKMKEGLTLVTTGIYAFVRHPMYLSVLVMSFSFLLASASDIQSFLFLSLVVVLYLKAKREESLWMKENEEYDAYRKKTKLFLPYVL